MLLSLLVAALAAVAAADSGYSAPALRAAAAPVARILEFDHRADDAGNYQYRFTSDDAISREEERAGDAVFGSYSYVSPEGVEVSVRYVADAAGGFRAESDVLPTPVPTQYPTPEVPSTEAPTVRLVVEEPRAAYAAPTARAVVEEPRAAYAPPVRAVVVEEPRAAYAAPTARAVVEEPRSAYAPPVRAVVVEEPRAAYAAPTARAVVEEPRAAYVAPVRAAVVERAIEYEPIYEYRPIRQ